MRTKLLLLLAGLLFFFLSATVASLIGLYRINQSSSVITDRETPFVRSIEEALFAMLQGQFAAERLLDLDDPSESEEEGLLKKSFDQSNERFKMFMAAITWGSEGDAFKQSDNGRNFRTWVDAGYAGTLVVQESPPAQTEHAGRINIYYGGYINNVQRAIEARENYLALKSENSREAEEARSASKNYQIKARRFADLTVSHLKGMIELSNAATDRSAKTLHETEDSVQGITLIVSIIGLLVSIAIGLSFAEKIIVEPILALAKAARAFGAGNSEERVDIRSRDEFETLGHTFNDMAGKLAQYTARLEAEVTKRTEELKEKVSELASANEQLRELDKAKSEFISVAAHQLRTPLSAIKWILGILIDEESGNLTPEQKSLLFKGFESNERMINLINEMLIVTRIESGKIEYSFVPVHVENIIENTLIDFSSPAHVRKVKLNFASPVSPLPPTKADFEKIRNVLQNVIENAMRYTPDGGTITVSASQEGNNIQVKVADSGIGIPAAQQSSIFAKFFRADNAMKFHTDGSGLGLFIAKSMVEKHGGRMWFESIEGKGSSFYFTIPITK